VVLLHRCLDDARHVTLHRTMRLPGLDTPMASGILQGLKAITARWRLFSA
jgi:serine/threonine-protein kinase